MAATDVVVIDSSDSKRLQAKAVLEFIDAGPVVMSDCESWRKPLAEPGRILAILVGECDSISATETLIAEVKKTAPGVPLLVSGGESARDKFSVATREQMLSFLEWPIKYRQLTSALQQARQVHEKRGESEGSQRSPELFRSLVGNSRSIRHVRKLIEQVANTDANVLILGESGTGKEVVARNVHYHSARRDKPFVPINCGAIPADLLESELFGHEKGAFTGAISARQGRFELAEGGTLFLDEIGDMSLHMQVKLLRVLQERTFERVGSNKTITADVRIIAATHRNLEEAIAEGKFREDLYYRLNVFPIEMPPLRVRVEDIPLLITELVTRLEYEKRGSTRLTPGAIHALCQYPWPGNVREMANLIERLVIMYPYGLVDAQDLPEKFRHADGKMPPPEEAPPAEPQTTPFADYARVPRLPREGLDLKEHLANLEYSLIKQALDEAGGVVAHAAQRLKLRRTTLVEKLRKYGLQRADELTES